MKVLIVEDDPVTRQGLLEIMQAEGYHVIAAADGVSGLKLFDEQNPDFVCLDIMMPGRDGYEVCRQIRHRNQDVPVIFISAKSEEIDKVVGLELGADDFIPKPFGVREVVARIRAVTRRCLARKPTDGAGNPENSDIPDSFALGDRNVVPRELRARRGTTTIELSLREIKLLKLFRDNPGKALDRMAIFRACWDEEHIPTSRTLDQHIAQLRKRIETDPKTPRLISTVHGVGYRFDP